MSLPLPSSLSPSKVSAFKDCALAFRFSAIDRLPEPPSPWAVKGTLVHATLERLFWHNPQGERTRAAAHRHLDEIWAGFGADEEFGALELSDDELEEFRADAAVLVDNYFEIEDPNAVRMNGAELMLEADVGSLKLRGIIDRLELDDDGELVVTDYKTGRAPSVNFEQNRLAGVHFYAFLCEAALGRRPARVQLLHLREPVAIICEPSAQSTRALRQRALAVWAAVERACERDDFRPKVSALCDWCSFRAYCPAWGGDPAAALNLAAWASESVGADAPTGAAPAHR